MFLLLVNLNHWLVKNIGTLRISLVVLIVLFVLLLIWEIISYKGRISSNLDSAGERKMLKSTVEEAEVISPKQKRISETAKPAADSGVSDLGLESAPAPEVVETETDVWQKLINKSISERPQTVKSVRKLEVISEETKPNKDFPVSSETRTSSEKETQDSELSEDLKPKE